MFEIGKRMLFKEALNTVSGLRYIAEHCLRLRSSAGRRKLYEMPFMTEKGKLEEEYEKVGELLACFQRCRAEGKGMPDFGLEQLKDIRRTLERLQKGSVPDDIELYEIKHLAWLSEKIRAEAEAGNLRVVRLPVLSPVFGLLDPENTRIPRFYIYAAYLPELGEVRKALQGEKNEERREELRQQERRLEDRIRERLALQLEEYAPALSDALEQLANLDVWIAKAEFGFQWNLCRPCIGEEKTFYRDLFHPEVKAEVEGREQLYQPVDVGIERRATVITGANMSGKSVLLKTLALAQCLAQFGFWLPAVEARVVPVEEIWIGIGDEQDEKKGLSSYAAEMLHWNRLIRKVQEGKKMLALADEPARTTNPAEGRALVNAFADFLTEHQVLSMITTHYGGLKAECRRLRMRGFREDKVTGKLTAENINSYMDYSLEEDREEKVPQEALRIAEILGVNSGLIENAEKYLKNDARK